MKTRILQIFIFLIIFSPLLSQPAYSDDSTTTAKFSVKDDKQTGPDGFGIDVPMVSVVATIQKHPLWPKYQWLKLDFYSFPLTEQDLTSAKSGDDNSIAMRRYNSSDVKHYNNSNATVILSIDETSKQIGQVDIAVPGHTCTIAVLPEEIKLFSDNYSLENNHIKIKSQGSNKCATLDTKFSWDFNVDAPVLPVEKK